MDSSRTRMALHGIAELLLAGPQYAATGRIALRVLPRGLGTVTGPDLRLVGFELHGPGGRAPASGTFADAAARIGVTPRRLDDVYSGGLDIEPTETIDADPAALADLLDALARGDSALRTFDPSQEPVL